MLPAASIGGFVETSEEVVEVSGSVLFAWIFRKKSCFPAERHPRQRLMHGRKSQTLARRLRKFVKLSCPTFLSPPSRGPDLPYPLRRRAKPSRPRAARTRAEGIAATPDQNTLTITRPGDPTRFFAIAERDAPPVFEDDFESDKGWVAGGTSGTPATAWQRGTPDSSSFVDPVFGPDAAFSGTNCQGTNLTAVYGPDAAVTLTSPAFTVPAGGATLTFQQVVNIDGPTAPIGEGADFGTLRVLDASDDSELAVIESGLEGGTSGDWTEYTTPMPSEANGLSVKLEFGLFSDSDGGSPDTFELAGWYIDDVVVTAD